MNDTSLRRFDADGKTAEPGFNVTFPSEKAALVTQRGTSIFVARNNTLTNVSWGGWITKLTESGGKDGSYGAVQLAPAEQTVFAIDVDDRAVTFAPTPQPASIVRRVPAGGATASAQSDLRHPQTTRAALYLADHSVVVAGENYLAKLLSDNATVDTTFGSNGFTTLDSSLKLNDAVIDGGGGYLVTGLTSTGALYLGRVGASGVADTTFSAVTSPYIAKTESFAFQNLLTGDYSGILLAGRLALDGDKNILQAGQITDGSVVKCAIVRYSKLGVIDAAFGANGLAKPDVPGCYSHRVAVQPDGRIVLGGPVVIRVWN